MRRWWPIPVVLGLTLVAYLLTLSPTVGLIDSGELAAGCYLLNIVHPTGYPLYTLLGRLATIVPLGTVVNRVAAMSGLLAAVGVSLFALLLLRLGLQQVVAAATALLLGFSLPVWSVAVDVEVHALTLAILGVLWLATERAEHGGELLLFSFLCGLALTNHMSAASAVLGAVFCVAMANRFDVRRQLPLLGAMFVLGLSLYLFLVLRTWARPLLAWGNPYNIERFWWHVTGKQYQVWMFSTPVAEVLRNAARGAALLARGLLYVGVPAAVYGALRFGRERPGLAAGLGVTALVSFAYAVNYSIPDIDAYYLPCLYALLLFAAFGLQALVRRIGRWQILVLGLPLVALALNVRVASRRGDYVALDAAENTLVSARANAIILTDFWDFYAPSFYLQHVEGVRPDLCIIDKELLRRSWYFGYLARQYPWLIERSRSEVEAYLEWLDQFEHGRLRDPAGIQRAFIRMIASFVERNSERTAYTTFAAGADQDARELLPQMLRVPVGLLFELRTDSVLPEFDYRQWRIRLPLHQLDERTRLNLNRYHYFVSQRAAALVERGLLTEADSLLWWYQNQPVNRLFGTGRR